MTKVFFCEPTDQVFTKLRVYESCDGDMPPCPLFPGQYSRHDASSDRVAVITIPAEEVIPASGSTGEYAGDERWPTACGCGHVFGSGANRSVHHQRLVRRTDTGEAFEGYQALPVGAVWNAFWMVEGRRGDWVGPDGRSLVCRLPDGSVWMIDSRASNCTMPDDDVHKCWVRHGRPEDGDLHVDKAGHTCAAGAGSIATPTWHGFLHHGQLTVC
ncbi:hypothetical protein [Caulobacter sp. Root343]|uniref:hypothetical protein n=1 Tax=Caulobacter sp. Root343 TaxID=1736520 RepID=UPI0006FB17EC|nr:hypothetical protein [Caulobacter sp. Root343]KQV66654.1 hypothetical protein ASC70_12535 [Caulobacter sp. Root343]